MTRSSSPPSPRSRWSWSSPPSSAESRVTCTPPVGPPGRRRCRCEQSRGVGRAALGAGHECPRACRGGALRDHAHPGRAWPRPPLRRVARHRRRRRHHRRGGAALPGPGGPRAAGPHGLGAAGRRPAALRRRGPRLLRVPRARLRAAVPVGLGRAVAGALPGARGGARPAGAHHADRCPAQPLARRPDRWLRGRGPARCGGPASRARGHGRCAAGRADQPRLPGLRPRDADRADPGVQPARLASRAAVVAARRPGRHAAGQRLRLPAAGGVRHVRRRRAARRRLVGGVRRAGGGGVDPAARAGTGAPQPRQPRGPRRAQHPQHRRALRGCGAVAAVHGRAVRPDGGADREPAAGDGTPWRPGVS